MTHDDPTYTLLPTGEVRGSHPRKLCERCRWLRGERCGSPVIAAWGSLPEVVVLTEEIPDAGRPPVFRDDYLTRTRLRRRIDTALFALCRRRKAFEKPDPRALVYTRNGGALGSKGQRADRETLRKHAAWLDRVTAPGEG